MKQVRTASKRIGFIQIPVITIVVVSILLVAFGANVLFSSKDGSGTPLLGNISSVSGEPEQVSGDKQEVKNSGLREQEDNDTAGVSNNNLVNKSAQTINPQLNQQDSSKVSELEKKLLGLKSELETLKIQQENQGGVDDVDKIPASTSTTLFPTPQIFSISATPIYRSATINWETDIPTESKIFVSGIGLSNKVFNSENGLSTRHATEVMGLIPGETYNYEVESITPSNQVTKITGVFKTNDSKFLVERNTPAGTWIFKSQGEPFTIEAISLLADKSLDGIITTTSSNISFNSQRISFRTCDVLRSLFQEFSNKLYPYPCPAFMFSYSISKEDHRGGTYYNLNVDGISKLVVGSGGFVIENGIEMFFLKARGELTQRAVCFAKSLPLEATTGTKDCSSMVLLP